MSVKLDVQNPDLLPSGAIRRSLPLAQWPQDLRQCWRAFKEKCIAAEDDILVGSMDRQAGAPSCRQDLIAKTSLQITENTAGRWLLFVAQSGRAVLPDETGFGAWYRFEEALGLAPVTQATHAFRLWRFCIVVWPKHDWTWMNKIWRGLKKAARPTKDKRSKLRASHDIEALGFELMNEAVASYECGKYRAQAAVQYRDGLMLLMWAQKPLRLANMAALTFADFDPLPDGRLRLNIARTKNEDGDEAVYDEDIAEALTDWREVFRPLLKPAPDCLALWIGRLGQPMKAGGLYQACTYRTKQAFGVALNPHLIRDCAARTIAEHSPEAAHAISTLLGHRDQRSAKHYLGQSMMIGGGVKLDEIWDEYRVHPLVRKRR